MRLILRVLTVCCSLAGTGLLWMGQVGPEDAASNFAKWAKLLGVGVPKWLHDPSAHLWISLVGGVLLAFGLAGVWLWVRRSRNADGAEPRGLVAVANEVGSRIFAIAADYQPQMPNPLDPEGARRISDANRGSEKIIVARYLAHEAANVQRIGAAAQSKGLLTDHEVWWLSQRPVGYQAVEEFGRLMFRIAERSASPGDWAKGIGPVSPKLTAPKSQLQPNMRLEDVVKRITGLHDLPSSTEPRSKAVSLACGTLREKALLNQLAVFGGLHWRTTRPADYDNMVRARIPPEYWKDHVIDVIGFLGIEVGDYRGRTEDLAGTWGDPGYYYGIWFDKDEIDALWPPT